MGNNRTISMAAVTPWVDDGSNNSANGVSETVRSLRKESMRNNNTVPHVKTGNTDMAGNISAHPSAITGS